MSVFTFATVSGLREEPTKRSAQVDGGVREGRDRQTEEQEFVVILTPMRFF